MGSIRYIGSKARLSASIIRFAGKPSGRFLDLFCGTGAVSAAAANAGWKVVSNDHLNCATTLTAAQLVCNSEAAFVGVGGYLTAVEHLNQLPGEGGFITKEYSPVSIETCGIERRYFTTENASRIDAIREQIRAWKSDGSINRHEEVVLIADLLEATNSVANIAGTYGCFLKKWTPTGLGTLRLVPRQLRKRPVGNEQIVGDVFQVPAKPDDLVYLDPPYTKRQYASYYHILETIALQDRPMVEGVCGLRPWKHLSSPFCFKRKAQAAMVDLIRKLAVHRILISYSSEGHISVPALANELCQEFDVAVHEIMAIGRYRPNEVASANGSRVSEYLIDVRRKASQ